MRVDDATNEGTGCHNTNNGINVFELQYVPSSKAIVYVSNGSVIQLSDDFEIIRIITVEGTGTVGNDGAYYRWLRGT